MRLLMAIELEERAREAEAIADAMRG